MTALQIATAGPYNILLLLALSVGFAIAWRQGRRTGTPRAEWLALLALTATAGLVGSRLLHFDAGAASGAKTILGGVLLATTALFAGVRFLRLDPRAADALAVALPVGFAIGRVGCLLAGCCFGHPTDLPWGAIYDEHSAAFRAQLAVGLIPADAAASLPVHPTQLYEAALALFAAMGVPRLRQLVRRPGSVLLSVVIALGIGRLLLEFFRARDVASFGGLTQVQWLIAAAAGVAGLLLFLRERGPAASDAAVPARPRVNAMRVACIAVIPVLLLIIGGAQFSPIERLLLVLLALPPLGALVGLGIRATERRAYVLATPAALSCGLLAFALQQQPVESAGRDRVSEPGYPRITRRVGVSFAGGESFQTHFARMVSDGCGGMYPTYETVDARYRVAGAGYTQTTDFAPRRSTTVRFSGFVGRERVIPGDSSVLRPDSSNLGGVSAAVTLDRGWFGFTGGMGFGTFSGDTARGSIAPIAGIRIGRAHGLHVFAAANDVEPMAHPKHVTRVGLGYAFGTSGSAIRAGAWIDHPFVSGSLALRGFTIEPSVVFSKVYPDVRLSISRRISSSSPADRANSAR